MSSPIHDWLAAHDKWLWGTNATYKDAAKVSPFTARQLTDALWRSEVEERVDEATGEIHAHPVRVYTGVCRYWKSPDYEKANGKYKAPKKGLTEKQWWRLRVFVTENYDEIRDCPICFAVRLARRQRLPANLETMAEVFRLKKMKVIW